MDFDAVPLLEEEEGDSAGPASTAVVEEAAAEIPVPADCSVSKCRVCGEQFEIDWDATKDEWVLQDAVRVNADPSPSDDSRTVVVHRLCRDATCGRAGTLTADHLLPDTPTKPNRTAEDDVHLDTPPHQPAPDQTQQLAAVRS